MKFPKRLAAAAGLCIVSLGLSLLGGCMTGDLDDGDPWIDPFPKPLGDAYIPLQQEFFGAFHYVEFDSAGGLVMRRELELQVIPKGNGLYGYAFETPESGTLLAFRDGDGNRDSAGIWIMGSFEDSVQRIAANPVLWLPQFPKPGTSWEIGPGRRTEMVDADTSFWTDALFPTDPDSTAPVRQGFQRQPTTLFKETKGDTVTFYHFRRGVGCVGFERAARGKLIAAGTLFRFYGRRMSSGGRGF